MFPKINLWLCIKVNRKKYYSMTQLVKKKENRKGNVFEINQLFRMMENPQDYFGHNVLHLFLTLD